MLAGRGSSSGRDDTLSRLPCQFHAIQNNSVLWRSVVVERTDHINASSFMEAVSAAYLDCREWDKASTEICAPKDRASPCCLFVGTDGRRRALVPLWGVDHSTGAAIEGLVFRQRMFRTLEIGMFQGNTAYHILNAHLRLGVKGSKHTNIQPDPWGLGAGVALTSIKRTGMFFHSRVLDGLSQHLLPALVTCEGGSYDLVLVDGLHTFEQSIIDMYYGDLLLRKGGFLLLDDVTEAWPPVEAAAAFWNNSRVGYGYEHCSRAHFYYPSPRKRSAPPS